MQTLAHDGNNILNHGSPAKSKGKNGVIGGRQVEMMHKSTKKPLLQLLRFTDPSKI
jgi:hypothetical protein